MTDENVATSALQNCEPTGCVETKGKNLRWFELSLVLLVSFTNSLFSSIHVLLFGRGPAQITGDWRWTAQLMQEVVCLLLLGYVLARRGLGFKNLGMRWSTRDFLYGLLLYGVSFVCYTIGYLMIRSINPGLFSAHLNKAGLRAIFGPVTFMEVPFTFVNPFFEELIVRAFLMNEIKALTGSWFLAALASTLLQSSYHLYYGWGIAICICFQFSVLSAYYAKTQRATPVIFAHFMQDLIGMLRMI